MRGLWKRVGLAAATALVALAGSASAETLRMMTGPQGGSWYPLGGAIANIAEKSKAGFTIQVLPGAGIANVKGIETGKADLGFANTISTVDAINGEPPFEQKAQNVCHLGSLYPQYFQIAVPADSGVRTIGDLKGKSIATQPKGNTGEQITRHALKAYGLTYDDLSKVNYVSYTDAVSLVKDGNAVAFFAGTTIPASAFMDLASGRDIRVLPIPDEQFAAMKKMNAGYEKITIPAGTYPKQDQPVQTVGYATHLIARCDLSPEIVYSFLQGITENTADLAAVAKAMQGLEPKQMATDIGVPLHEGAKKFYQEKGAL